MLQLSAKAFEVIRDSAYAGTSRKVRDALRGLLGRPQLELQSGVDLAGLGLAAQGDEESVISACEPLDAAKLGKLLPPADAEALLNRRKAPPGAPPIPSSPAFALPQPYTNLSNAIKSSDRAQANTCRHPTLPGEHRSGSGVSVASHRLLGFQLCLNDVQQCDRTP